MRPAPLYKVTHEHRLSDPLHADLQDLALDNPDAAHLLSLFLGRAIVDEALPPSFLASVLPSLRNDSLGVAVVQSTGIDC